VNLTEDAEMAASWNEFHGQGILGEKEKKAHTTTWNPTKESEMAVTQESSKLDFEL
jgi:hypothetical protein